MWTDTNYCFGNNKEQLDMYLKWKKEFRKCWLLGEKPSDECRKLKDAFFDVYVDPYNDGEDPDYTNIKYRWNYIYGK